MSTCPLMEWNEDVKYQLFKQYERNRAEVEEDIANVREWMKKQPHLPEIMADERIERFLLMNKFSLEKCKRKIDMYYSLKALIPEIYSNRLPTNKRITDIMEVVANLPTRRLMDDLKRVVCFKLFDTDASKFHPMDVFAYTFLIADVRLSEDYCMGDVTCFDLTGMTWEHLVKFTPSYIKKIFSIVESQLSSRLSGIHFVNGPSFLETFLSLLRSVLPQKYIDRIHVHQDFEALHKVLPKRVLPKDFGGEDISLKEMQAMWREKLMSYMDFFLDSETKFSNEKLRPGSPLKHLFSDFELQGSFRKLNID